uniref:Uncharacterized protein n=1 Tax=Anguilla anguilla TaxID=7936 RepID=A0A0E9T6F0_ANGAN
MFNFYLFIHLSSQWHISYTCSYQESKMVVVV